MALEWVSGKSYKQLLIATGYTSALRASECSNSNNQLVDRIRLTAYNYRHSGITEYEKADKLTKTPASGLSEMKKIPLTQKEACAVLHNVNKQRWNQRYMHSITGEHYKIFQPSFCGPIDSSNLSGK